MQKILIVKCYLAHYFTNTILFMFINSLYIFILTLENFHSLLIQEGYATVLQKKYSQIVILIHWVLSSIDMYDRYLPKSHCKVFLSNQVFIWIIRSSNNTILFHNYIELSQNKGQYMIYGSYVLLLEIVTVKMIYQYCFLRTTVTSIACIYHYVIFSSMETKQA